MKPSGFALIAVWVLWGGASVGDTIQVGGNTYENVYVAESSSKYIVCFPADGAMMVVPKSDVAPESLLIIRDYAIRRSMYDRWVAMRNEGKRHAAHAPGARPPQASAHAPTVSQKTAGGDATARPQALDMPDERTLLYGTGSQLSRYIERNDEKLQRQAVIEAERRRQAVAKRNAQRSQVPITSESAHGGGFSQWNSPVRWGDPVGWGGPTRWNNSGGWNGYTNY